MLKLRPYQQEAVDSVFQWFEGDGYDANPLIVLPTGCHAAGTKILMFDGSDKAVEDVVVGDLLMGPDSKPRTVLRLARGNENMNLVTPIKGDPFVVNDGHILSFKTTNEGKKHFWNTRGGDIENVSVRDWRGKSKYWKHLRKLYYASVDFPETKQPPMDAWALGCLIGDGCILNGISLSNPDAEVLSGVTAVMENYGLKVRSVENERKTCWDLHYIRDKSSDDLKNPVTTILRELNLYGCGAGEKFIPDIYKRGSRETRLNMLAGLLDTDGHLDNSGTFDFISKSEKLSKDVVFICRSLGLWAKAQNCQKFCQTGGGGTYWRVNISGDLSIIPTRVARKVGQPRKQKKNPLVTGFGVESIGKGDFYGFELDGDHLYLTADFMVHHNTGKSLVLSEICKRSIAEYGDMKIVVVTHVMELIKQNYEELKGMWPSAPAGIYSAGVGRREHQFPITFCGIQSVHKKAVLFQKVDFVIIDEAHLIPRNADTMYRRFLEKLRIANPKLKIIGLTATPYRMDSGMLHRGDGALFDDICYEYSVLDAIKQGYLSNLITKKTELELDTTGVHTRGGEFIAAELQDAVDVEGINERAVEEIMGWGQTRKSWLIFGSGVQHCKHLAEMLVDEGITCETIFGDTPKDERASIIDRFKKGQIRALCSMGVLTTGFNAPNVDMIAILRPTQSAGLFVQIVGRGMRLHPDKENCLILDFARNIQRHGPIDQIRGSTRDFRERTEESAGPLVKDCPECMSVVHLACTECPDCGYVFPREVKIVSRASDLPVLSVAAPVQRLEVDDVLYSTHTKPGKPPSLKVSYACGFLKYSEWICLEHPGFASQKARAWWLRHAGTTPPMTVKEALERKKEIKKPEAIEVKKEGKYDRVVRTFLPVSYMPSNAQRVAV